MRGLRWPAVLAAVVVVEWLWSTYFAPGGVAPQLFLLATVAAASAAGPVAGEVCGFLLGLAWDVAGTHVFGAHALLLTLTGYGTGLLRRQMDVSGSASQLLLVGLLTPAYFLAYGLLGRVFERDFLWVGWRLFLLAPFYNCLVAPVIFALMRRVANGRP